MKRSSLYGILGVGSLMVASLIGINCSRRETRTELSDIFHSEATVASMEHNDPSIEPDFSVDEDEGLSVDFDYSQEENIIEFRGKVDFKIDNKEIYERFKEGDLANVSYREKYNATFEDLDGDGKKEEIGRELKDYVFIDAVKK